MELLDTIIQELLLDANLKEKIKSMPDKDFPFLHYTLGAFIRNKYLWGKKRNVALLSKHLNLENVDDISGKLIDIFIEIIEKET